MQTPVYSCATFKSREGLHPDYWRQTLVQYYVWFTMVEQMEMGKSQHRSHINETLIYNNWEPEHEVDNVDEAELQLKIESELSDLQLALEQEHITDLAQGNRVKSLPNDWQDFEPNDWDDTDLFD